MRVSHKDFVKDVVEVEPLDQLRNFAGEVGPIGPHDILQFVDSLDAPLERFAVDAEQGQSQLFGVFVVLGLFDCLD